jgi:hypothetical protein
MKPSVYFLPLPEELPKLFLSSNTVKKDMTSSVTTTAMVLVLQALISIGQVSQPGKNAWKSVQTMELFFGEIVSTPTVKLFVMLIIILKNPVSIFMVLVFQKRIILAIISQCAQAQSAIFHISVEERLNIEQKYGQKVDLDVRKAMKRLVNCATLKVPKENKVLESFVSQVNVLLDILIVEVSAAKEKAVRLLKLLI